MNSTLATRVCVVYMRDAYIQLYFVASHTLICNIRQFSVIQIGQTSVSFVYFFLLSVVWRTYLTFLLMLLLLMRDGNAIWFPELEMEKRNPNKTESNHPKRYWTVSEIWSNCVQILFIHIVCSSRMELRVSGRELIKSIYVHYIIG